VESLGILTRDVPVFKLPAITKLLEVRQKWRERGLPNVSFYIKKSFMPSLDKSIGDLAQSYGTGDIEKN